MKCPHCGAGNADDARFCGVCGRATSATEPSRVGALSSQLAAPDLAGREIAGRYRILTKLGEGGMGAVYRGEQISLKRKCAIKLLKPELSSEPALVKRFNAEAELVARLSHPNVVNIYDFGQDADGTLFIAMEFIEGRSLRAAMTSDGPLPARRAVAIAAQVASSLTDAHAHGIVHRDLKPDNVMLTERGKEKDVVRVLDFGIAKLRDEGKNTVQQMTQAGDLVGTPQYMAPEQIRGDKVDGRTDVYALGAMLYEMVTGRLPFEGPTVMAILSKHLTQTPEVPSVRRPDLGIPPSIDALVMASLAKDPAQRVQSMEVVGEQLATIGMQLGGSASQPFVIPVAPAGAWQPGMPTQANAAMPGLAANATPHAPYPIVAAPPAIAPRAAQQLAAVPTGTPPPLGIAATTPAPARSRTGLLIAISAGAVLAIGVVALALGRGGKTRVDDGSGSSPGTGSASASDDNDNDHDVGSGSAIPPPIDKDGSGSASDDPWSNKPPAPLDGTPYNDPAGWSILVPTGFGPAQHDTMGVHKVTYFENKTMGESGIAIVDAFGMPPSPNDAQAAAMVSQFARDIQGTLVSFDWVVYRGERRLHAIYDVKAARVDSVLYARGTTGIVVMYGVDPQRFDATASLRHEIFDRRVTPP